MKAIEIGAFEAKNRLSELPAKAEKGQRIYITRRGRRVAILTSADPDDSAAPSDKGHLLRQIWAFRTEARPGSEPLKRLIEEGRR